MVVADDPRLSASVDQGRAGAFGLWLLAALILIQFFTIPALPGVNLAPENFVFLAAILAFGPKLARLAFAAPKALIATLAGLAMLKVLQGAFVGAFRGAYPMSALVTFLITVSGVAIFNIGAPFWGIVFGYLTARLIERDA
mgnify:CR=1 FL=1